MCIDWMQKIFCCQISTGFSFLKYFQELPLYVFSPTRHHGTESVSVKPTHYYFSIKLVIPLCVFLQNSFLTPSALLMNDLLAFHQQAHLNLTHCSLTWRLLLMLLQRTIASEIVCRYPRDKIKITICFPSFVKIPSY